MATLENRSRYCVSVKNRDDLTAFFPFNKFAATQAHMALLLFAEPSHARLKRCRYMNQAMHNASLRPPT